jgi:hypothetical protein
MTIIRHYTRSRQVTLRIHLVHHVPVKNLKIKMNEIIDMVNEMDSAIEADPLHSEVRILDWILYIVCSNE